MSLYNMLFGQNPLSPLYLEMVGLPSEYFRRFRDAYLNDDGTQIIVYTRCGGGNRDDYFPTDVNEHPLYIKDCDDEFDCTYAYIYFKVPEDVVYLTKEIIKMENGDSQIGSTVSEMFQSAMDDMMNNPDSEYLKKSMPIVNAMSDAMESGKSGAIVIDGNEGTIVRAEI
jgi:hypothetical protein